LRSEFRKEEEMVKFTDEMKEALHVPGKGGSVTYLCTSSLEGKPNIEQWGDDKVLIADMFLLKTKANIKENPECIIAIAHPLAAGEGRYWAFKGKAMDIEYGIDPDFEWYGAKAGDVLEEWGDWHGKEPPEEVPPDIVYTKAAQRGVVVLHVEEVYSLKPGEVGKKIM
jgi:hypothetical protein